ncbi:MAG: hypothetical protein WCA29_15440, partial [Jiangellales bacterium]
VGRLAAWTAGPALARDLDEPGVLAAARAIRVAGDVRLSGPPLVLELHDEPTIAAGEVPWAIGEPLAERLPGTVVVRLVPHAADPLPTLGLYADRPVVLAVRGLRRRAWQREVVEVVRAHRPDVIVVDHELSADRAVLGPHHLRTFSGSRVSAEVAADMLSGRTPLPATSDV